MHHLMLKQKKVNQRVTDLEAIGELQSFIGYSVKAATLDSWEKKTHEVILLTIERFFETIDFRLIMIILGCQRDL
jgi:hypothetical protein